MKEFVDTLINYQGTETLTVPAKNLIVHNGGRNRGVFVILAGSALIFRDNPSKVTGLRKAAFIIVHQDTIIGSELLGGSKVYENSARALNDCEVLRIPSPSFKQAMRYTPELALVALNSLTEDLSCSYRRIGEMRMPANKIVARAILEFSNHLGGNLSLIDEKDIAMFSHVHPQTVARVVAGYKRVGAINPEVRRWLEILDRPLLEEMAKPTAKGIY